MMKCFKDDKILIPKFLPNIDFKLSMERRFGSDRTKELLFGNTYN